MFGPLPHGSRECGQVFAQSFQQKLFLILVSTSWLLQVARDVKIVFFKVLNLFHSNSPSSIFAIIHLTLSMDSYNAER